MINAPHGYLWGPVGQVIFIQFYDNNIPRGSDWGKSGNLPRYLEFCMTFLVVSHCQCQLSGCPSSPTAISILGALLGALTGVTRYVGTPQPTNQPTNPRPNMTHSTNNSAGEFFATKQLRPIRKTKVSDSWAIWNYKSYA